MITSGAELFVGVPQVITFTTTYAPPSNLTIIPQGAFTFNPPVVTLTSSLFSATVTATPKTDGNLRISLGLAGPDAALYASLGVIEVIVHKCTPIFVSFSH